MEHILGQVLIRIREAAIEILYAIIGLEKRGSWRRDRRTRRGFDLRKGLKEVGRSG